MPNTGSYLLSPWCRVLLEKLTGLQLVKKFPAFHGTRRFITALTSFRHLSVSWASPIQSIYPHPTSWRSILILSTHLRLGLPSGLLPSGFSRKTLYTPLSSPIRATCPAHLIGLTICICNHLTWCDKFGVHWAVHHNVISIVKPIGCTEVSNLFYFGITLYMFRTVFPSIIRSSRLYIQQQAFVKRILQPAC